MEFKKFDAADFIEDESDVLEFLSVAVEMGGLSDLPRALGTVMRSKGMTKIAKKTGLSREALYKSFSEDGNPTIASIDKVLKACGLRMEASFSYLDPAEQPEAFVKVEETLQTIDKREH